MSKRRVRRLNRARQAVQAVTAIVLLLGVATAVVIVANRFSSRPIGPLIAWAATVVVLLAVGAVLMGLVKRVPKRTILELDLAEPVVDDAQDPMAKFSARGKGTLRQIVEALDHAAGDDRIAGLVARIGTPAGGLADVQELRDAVSAFRASGKFAVAYAETFGEFAAANGAYYLACAFDEIWVQPSGDIGLTGLAAEVTFMRGTFDKLGVTPQLEHRHEYKNAKNRVTETAFTPAHREASARIVDSQFEQILTGVADGRGLDTAEVTALVDAAPVPSTRAVEAGLVDYVGYRDQVIDAVKQRGGDGAELLSVDHYRKRAVKQRRRKATGLALIHGSGAVVQGSSRFNPLTMRSMGSDTVAKAFRQAVADRKTEAILFRVDSPGGSYVASDTIWRETVRAKEAGKPVIVSMGNVAGSGGYFVAMAADRIVAHPATITGSIGVVAGKSVTTGLKAKLGLSVDQVHQGAGALLFSSNHPYTDEQWAKLRGFLDRVYDDFTAKVAGGRELTIEQVREVAKGRVWTGADALERGLVDELGGYPAAMRAAREAVGAAADAPLRITTFPRKPTLRERLSGGAESSDETATLRQMVEAIAPAARIAGMLRAGDPDQVLLMHDW